MEASKREELRRVCVNMLRDASIKPTSKKGRELIHAYYLGALTALDDNDPRTVIMLMSGRHEELLREPQA